MFHLYPKIKVLKNWSENKIEIITEHIISWRHKLRFIEGVICRNFCCFKANSNKQQQQQLQKY